MELKQIAHAYDVEAYAANKDRAAKVRIGGNASSIGERFVPNINMSKWGDEHFINLNFPIAITNQIEMFDGEKVSLAVGDYTFNYYPLNTDDLEFEIVFGKKPPIMSFSIDILNSEGLDFILQPKLTQAEIDDHHTRPDNVVGSYAVYCRSKDNKYCTGKFCHIYYPYLRDADGKTVRVNSFDISAGKMTIVLPSAWMESAKYPVTLDPYIGYSTAGGSEWGTIAKVSTWSQATETGITSLYHCALQAVGAIAKGKMGIYGPIGSDGNPDGHARLEQSGEFNVIVSNDNQANAAGATITNASYYAVAWCAADQDFETAIKYDAAAGMGFYTNVTYVNEMTNPWSASNAVAYHFSIWCDYAAAGGNIIKKAVSYYNKIKRF